jgi:hypothetical protein
MGLFKKKYDKNVQSNNEFLKTYAIRVNGLMLFVPDGKVKDELAALKDDLQYTVPSASQDALSLEKKISREFDSLTKALEKPDFDEAEVLTMIRVIRRIIVEISSLR